MVECENLLPISTSANHSRSLLGQRKKSGKSGHGAQTRARGSPGQATLLEVNSRSGCAPEVAIKTPDPWLSIHHLAGNEILKKTGCRRGFAAACPLTDQCFQLGRDSSNRQAAKAEPSLGAVVRSPRMGSCDFPKPPPPTPQHNNRANLPLSHRRPRPPGQSSMCNHLDGHPLMIDRNALRGRAGVPLNQS